MGGAAASKPAGGASSGGADGADSAELARLRREVADLRRQLAAAGSGGGGGRVGGDADPEKDAWPRPAEGMAVATPTAHATHEAHARDVHAEHEHHERKLALKMESMRRASRKSLNARLAARLRVKQTKSLQKVPESPWAAASCGSGPPRPAAAAARAPSPPAPRGPRRTPRLYGAPRRAPP